MVMKHRGSHIFQTIGSQMVVRSALHMSCNLPENSLELTVNRTRDLPACNTVPQSSKASTIRSLAA
jgi:hypothetical protein